MESFLINFHFLRPWWLLLLLIPIFWFGRYWRSSANKSSWEKVVDERLLSYLLVKGSSGQRKVMAWLALLGIISAIIAAAGPSWVKMEIPSLEAENPLMIALNLSTDMQEEDLTPSRLERAKYKIKDLLDAAPEIQSGLMVYSAEPFVISPFSDDAKLAANLLPAISFDIMPANGDRADRAIALAVKKFQDAGFHKGEILLIAPDVGQGFDAALQEAKKAKELGFRVNILNASAQDNEKLQMLSEAGGGKYTRLLGTDADIRQLLQSLQKPSSALKESKNVQSVWLDYGYYLLSIPLLCCLYFFRKGIFIIIFSLMFAHSAQAGFFLNNDQEGLRAFNDSNFATASQKFEDPAWKAASYYRMGNYDEAYKQYAKGNDITSLYNQGNALAKGGKIEEAIAKYEEVLQLDPDHEDAKFNLEYLKRQQEQQQQQNNQQQSQDQNQEQNQDNQSAGGNGDNNSQNQEQNQPQGQDQGQNSNQNQGQDKGDENEQSSESGEQEPQGANSTPNQDSSQSPQNDKANNSSANGEPLGEQPLERQEGEQTPSGASTQTGKEDEEYDEKVQARAQQYREIPEDPGGLLKAFIYKEYARNRYND